VIPLRRFTQPTFLDDVILELSNQQRENYIRLTKRVRSKNVLSLLN